MWDFFRDEIREWEVEVNVPDMETGYFMGPEGNGVSMGGGGEGGPGPPEMKI